MRFEADDRLLDLLVGSSLYPEPEVCVRELLQNGWDAIEWRAADGDLVPEIVVRYSVSEHWFEVVDNGIGMSRDDIQESLLRVGRDKLEALGAVDAETEQVAYFGIGVLSVFLLADSVEFETKKVGEEHGLLVEIPDLHAEIEPEVIELADFGTRVRVRLSPGASFGPEQIPDAVRKYARHVAGVRLENVDTGILEDLQDHWDTADLVEISPVDGGDVIRDGRLGFSTGLLAQGGVVGNPVTLANAGFLVEEGALDLIALPPIGFAGELDVHPRALSIAMARDRFQRDESWRRLGAFLVEEFEGRALRALSEGFLSVDSGRDPAEVRRVLLIWAWTLTQTEELRTLAEAVRDRVFSGVTFPLAEQRSATLEAIVERSPEPRLYVRRVGSPTQRARHIDDEGLPIRLTEEVRDSVRVGALRAKGFPVMEVEHFQVTQQTPQGAVTQTVDEFQVIQGVLSPGDIQLLEVHQAPPEDMDLGSVERLPGLRNVLDVGGVLRFARIPQSNRRVVIDPSGTRYLNVANPTTRRLLATLAGAISNPLRRRLLEIYLHVEDFRIADARQQLLDLLEADNLADRAQIQGPVLASEAVAEAVESLLSELEDEASSE